MSVVFVTCAYPAHPKEKGVLCLFREQKREHSSKSARFLTKMFFYLRKYPLKWWSATPTSAFTIGLSLWKTTVRLFFLQYLLPLEKRSRNMYKHAKFITSAIGTWPKKTELICTWKIKFVCKFKSLFFTA